ncbi:MAG: bifunctional (p)ppGpp synthetase/guanosine-3',5'-bis(diphosphate) 3'-pyrophosphohydrolase [Deltaproteobacteria bacterium]|jgi:GTP pyrophosphokinase|nr:bifunctional (p)ppGpp synthetase/guanosine-3',5'-bis(diphosphate) 3'-pyrophosphohydrolase [Deltaproteobacteria bacterium]
MIRIQDIIDTVASYNPDADFALLQKAYVYAASAHAGQTRLSGEPYLSHPLEVAHTLAQLRLDEATIVAGLLHDTVEDTKATIEEIDENFGEEVADIVDGVTKISLMTFESKEEQQAENIRKMILAMSEDIRVLIVKLADRRHNMRTLTYQKSHKQRLIAQETMDIYTPLANRLGLHRMKLELEDLSFRYIKPDAYAHITEWLEKNRAGDEEYIDEVIGMLGSVLSQNEIKARIKGRIKHAYSIYHKMAAQNLTMDEMHDIIAFRVVVEDIKDCYAALGLVHASWRPVPGRFKDYISMPKANMYQSLHTTVIGPRNERMEVQIRTEEMDRLAENGLASHWLYKEGSRVKAKDVRQFTWLREMIDWQKMESDSREFLRSLRFDLFKDEIYVFTPKGEVKELPEGATPVDFAYQIHTQVGSRCIGAKVNGKLVPLSTALRSGDMVEILTDPNRHPSRDWLKFVKTAKARTRIQHYIRTEERERSISLGREILEKQGRKLGVNVAKALKDGDLAQTALEAGLPTVDELFSALGYARITPQKVLRLMLPKEDAEKQPPEEAEKPARKDAAPKKTDSVVIQGMRDVMVRYAKCCNPVPGDAIVGYISRGRGVTVHTSDCSTIQDMEPERIISVQWEGTVDSRPYPARIRIVSKNIMGVLGRIALALAEENVNIESGTVRTLMENKSELDFVVEVSDAAHLYHVIDKLRGLDSVEEVARGHVGPER